MREIPVADAYQYGAAGTRVHVFLEGELIIGPENVLSGQQRQHKTLKNFPLIRPFDGATTSSSCLAQQR